MQVEQNGVTSQIHIDELILAVGKESRLSGFGLEQLDIPMNRVVETN